MAGRTTDGPTNREMRGARILVLVGCTTYVNTYRSCYELILLLLLLMMLLLLLLPLFSKIVIVKIKLLWLWCGVAGILDRQLCTGTSSQPSTKRISMSFPYCHNSQVHITMRLIVSCGHGVHDAMRLILTWGIYYQKYHVTRMLMLPISLCHCRDHPVIRSMLTCKDPCSHDDHSAISC